MPSQQRVSHPWGRHGNPYTMIPWACGRRPEAVRVCLTSEQRDTARNQHLERGTHYVFEQTGELKASGIRDRASLVHSSKDRQNRCRAFRDTTRSRSPWAYACALVRIPSDRGTSCRVPERCLSTFRWPHPCAGHGRRCSLPCAPVRVPPLS